MSGREERTGGDSLERTGNLVHQTSVQGQKPESISGTVSSRLRRKRTSRQRPHVLPWGGETDQLTAQMVTQPMATQTQCDITSLASQDWSPVHDSTRLGSPTPVTQAETAAQSFEVSAEVYPAIDSESDAVSVKQGHIQAPPRMTLGIQVGSDLPYSDSPSRALFQSSNDEERLCLEIDLSKPLGEIISQLRAQLQLTRDPTTGGAGVTPLLNSDLVVFEHLVQTVGLENIPLFQPKKVACSGVHKLLHVLQGTQIHLATVVDHDSDVNDMSVAHDSSLPARFHSSDPLRLESERPVDLEDGQIIDNPHASDPMDQSEELGHTAHPGGSALSDLSVITGGVSDYPSEDVEITAHPSKSESHSSLPTVRQGTKFSHGNLRRKMRQLNANVCTPKHDPTCLPEWKR